MCGESCSRFLQLSSRHVTTETQDYPRHLTTETRALGQLHWSPRHGTACSRNNAILPWSMIYLDIHTVMHTDILPILTLPCTKNHIIPVACHPYSLDFRCIRTCNTLAHVIHRNRKCLKITLKPLTIVHHSS